MPHPYSVVVHPFDSPTAGSCAYERGSTQRNNALVFICGLTAGPHSADLKILSERLDQAAELSYSLWEFRMRSSFAGFGSSSLSNDAEDISALVKYLRSIGKQRIVLLGHSTGCQDCIQYARQEGTEAVDAYILQSPVSDREAASMFVSPEILAHSVQLATDMIASGKKNDCIPAEVTAGIFGVPVTAYRWHSLASVGGDDDFFSSDLPDERLRETFGKVDKPILFAPSGADEMVPPSVDREALLARWKSFCPPGTASGLSGAIPGADHVVSQPEAQKLLAEKVVEFLKSV